jgi:tRNA-dihydrouridine synthase
MDNIWESLKKPIWCLAPMFGVTDSAFRQLLVEIGKPDLMFTEFTNVQALFSADTVSSQQLTYLAKERPLVAQIWGLDPEFFEAAADLIAGVGFAGIDINFGCPEKSVVKKGACAGMIANPVLAGEIIRATRAGAKGRVPVSVKTRLGIKTIDSAWVDFLLSQNLAALTLHGRTAIEMSDAPVHWDQLMAAVRLRNRLKLATKIIINGDLFSREEALAKLKLTGADGAMLGRAVFHDPYVFGGKESIAHKSRQQKLSLIKRHLEIYASTWGETKSYHPLKRYFKIYVNGFPGALDLRVKLMATRSYAEARDIIKQ